MENMMRNKAIDGFILGLRTLYQERATALQLGLTANCPAVKVQNQVEGGYFLWCELPPHVEDPKAFAKYCVEKHHLNFLPGEACYYSKSHCGLHGGSRMIRLCFAMYDVEDLVEATRRLKCALENYK
jgi:2-aminoadipate transaminase